MIDWIVGDGLLPELTHDLAEKLHEFRMVYGTLDGSSLTRSDRAHELSQCRGVIVPLIPSCIDQRHHPVLMNDLAKRL